MLGSWDSCPDTELLNVSQTLAHSLEIMVYNVGSIFVFSVKLPSVEFAVWHVRKFWTMEQHGYQLFTSEMLKTSGHSQFSWRIMNMVLTGIPECLRLFWGHLLKGQRRLCCRRIKIDHLWKHSSDDSQILQRSLLSGARRRGQPWLPVQQGCWWTVQVCRRDFHSLNPGGFPLEGSKQNTHVDIYLSLRGKKCHGNMWCVQTRSEHPKYR